MPRGGAQDHLADGKGFKVIPPTDARLDSLDDVTTPVVDHALLAA